MIRDIIPDDVDYFIGAGKEYCELVGFDFDEEVFLAGLVEQVRSPATRFFVLDGKAHCVISLSKSIFGKDVIAKVLSTWGPGGTRCFREAMKWARESGATKIIADANLSPEIARFYKRARMKKYDTNYMGDL